MEGEELQSEKQEGIYLQFFEFKWLTKRNVAINRYSIVQGVVGPSNDWMTVDLERCVTVWPYCIWVLFHKYCS